MLGFDQYQVRVEGSRRLTLRNRRILRRFSKQPIAFVTLPVCERDGVDMEPEPMSATRQAKQVGTLEGRDGHGGVGAVPSQADVPDGVEDVHAKQPLQLVERGAAGHDLRVDMDSGGPPVDQQDGGNAVAVPSVGRAVSQPEVSPVRRSSRSTKGVTTKYKDVVQFQD